MYNPNVKYNLVAPYDQNYSITIANHLIIDQQEFDNENKLKVDLGI